MNLFRFFSVILTFYFVVFSGVKSDTSYISGGSYTERLHTPSAGITRANIDTSHSRHATADSATITVFKGTKTFRDSSYFAGGLRGLRLYMRTASVDTLYTNIMGLGTTTPQHRLHVNGNIRATAGNIGISNSVTSPTGEWYFYVGSDKSIGLKDNISNTFPIIIDSGAGNYGIRIVRGGLIGVKTNTPDSNLTVGGSAHVTGNARIDGGLRLGSGDFLSVYDTGSFACTTKVGEGFTVQKIGRIRYTIIGDVVTMEIDSQFIGTSNSNFWLLRTGMPIHLMPTKETYSPIGMVMDNGVYVAASACMYSSTDAVNDSLIMIIPTDGNGAFTLSGTKGFNGQYPNAKTCWTYKK